MLIYIDFDKSLFSKEQIQTLTKEFQSLIGDTVNVENNVPTYASIYEVSSDICPIEIFIKISRKYINNRENLADMLRHETLKWKEKNRFAHKINLTIIPMDWELVLDI